MLTLHSVTRAASGEYLCRASNGVGPDATDKVKKYFKPMTLPTRQGGSFARRTK